MEKSIDDIIRKNLDANSDAMKQKQSNKPPVNIGEPKTAHFIAKPSSQVNIGEPKILNESGLIGFEGSN